jgi:curved DNA-binding protein CbpA
VIGRRTYYQVLMVDPSADQEILAVVHRRLAQRYHPDIDPSDEARQRMTEVNQAYEVLRDAEKRARYDRELASRRDRRASDRYIRRPVESPGGSQAPAAGAAGTTRRPAPESPFGEAGPPPRGIARGTVLDFGRYKGWSIGQIATHDPDFLEWLQRSPSGRQYRAEITAVLARLGR